MSSAFLTIDTASPFCSVAVRRDDTSIFSLVSEGEGNHFEKLPDLVAELLSNAGIVISDVGAIGVGVGPGSFTGIRIGMSFAKGLAWARKVPLSGFCSLGACAMAAAASQGSVGAAQERGGEDCSEGDIVAVISDAGRDELFFGVFRLRADKKEDFTVVAPIIIPRLELAGRLNGVTKVVSPQSALLASDAIKLVAPLTTAIELVREPARGGLHSVPCIAPGDSESQGDLPRRSLSAMIALEPSYLRQVAAKTIAERKQLTAPKKDCSNLQKGLRQI